MDRVMRGGLRPRTLRTSSASDQHFFRPLVTLRLAGLLQGTQCCGFQAMHGLDQIMVFAVVIYSFYYVIYGVQPAIEECVCVCAGSPASLDRRHYSSHCRVTLRRVGLTYVTGAPGKWEVPLPLPLGVREMAAWDWKVLAKGQVRFPAPTLKGAHNSGYLSLFLASLGTARMCTAPLPHSHLPRI